MDLCSENKEVVKKSIDFTEKVINHSIEVMRYFPNSKKPKIIFNVGGFSEKGFLSKNKVEEKYEIFADAYKSIDTSKIEFLPSQCLPFLGILEDSNFIIYSMIPRILLKYVNH